MNRRFDRAKGFGACHGCILTLLPILLFAGCSDSTSTTPSLSAQQQAAMKETDATLRARKLVAVAAKQFQAADTAGGESSLTAAVRAASDIKEPDSRSRVLTIVADSLAKNGNSPEAKKQLKAARSAADGVEDLGSRVALLTRCAEVLAQSLGDTDGGMDILRETERFANEITEPSVKVSAQLRIILALGALKATGDAERLAAVAVEGARTLEDARKRADGLSEAGEALHRVGINEQAQLMFQESRLAIDRIEDPHGKGYALLNLATHQKKAGARADAEKSLQAAESVAAKVADRSLREGLQLKIQQAQEKG